jgi:ribosome-interacting GTPase 1
MATTTKTLYDIDFVEWTAHTAEMLREGRLGDAVVSHLSRLLLHQIKRKIQPERDGASWRHSIITSRETIELKITDSPSLRLLLEKNLQKTYRRAVKDALFETGLKSADLPQQCPYTLDELIERDDL